MKKIIIKILLVLSFLSFANISLMPNTYAEETWEWWAIRTSIGMDLSPLLSECGWEKWNYYCDIPKWFNLVILLMWKMIKYITYLAWLAWVLYIIINGIMYSMWGLDQSLQEESKKRITATLIWLVLLFLSWIFLNIVAPWIYK